MNGRNIVIPQNNSIDSVPGTLPTLIIGTSQEDEVNPDNDNKPRLVAPKDAALLTSLSRPLLTLMSASGEFPRPVKLGERRIAYVRAEVEAWIDQRIAGRTAA